MKFKYMPRLKVVATLSLATLLAPALRADTANPARPGTLNYTEGQVTLNGQAVQPSSVGHSALDAGQAIETGNGRAEVLLTPGVFLRLGHNAAAEMLSPDLTHTAVRIDKGEANIEVDQLYKQNHIVIDEHGQQVVLEKTGLYSFNADSGTLRVFDGKAAVQPDGSAAKPEVVKGGHELALNGDAVKPQGFNKKASQDELYTWSSLRSEYLGEANMQLADRYAGTAGFAPGWLWNGGLSSYTWLPGDGAFLSPFGYGFYSPYYLYGGGPIYGYGYRGGSYLGGYRSGHIPLRGANGGPVARTSVAGGFHGSIASGTGAGGFHGGGMIGGGGHR